MWPSYKPHYASWPSVCVSLIWAGNSKTKKCIKLKIGIHIPHGMSKWSTNFQLKRSKVKVTGSGKPQEIDTSGIRVAGGRLHTGLKPLGDFTF